MIDEPILVVGLRAGHLTPHIELPLLRGVRVIQGAVVNKVEVVFAAEPLVHDEDTGLLIDSRLPQQGCGDIRDVSGKLHIVLGTALHHQGKMYGVDLVLVPELRES